MSAKARLAIDVLAAAAYLICANPAISGLAVHEWLSIGIVLVFVVHVAINLNTVAASIRRKAAAGAAGALNLALDIAILACFMAVTVSGLFVSRFVLPAMGLYAQGYWVWLPVHAVSAKILLALIIVHVATHLKPLAASLAQGAKR
jgi:hypothetical protein